MCLNTDFMPQRLFKKAVFKLVTWNTLAFLGQPLLRAVQFALSVHHREVVSFDQPCRRDAIARVREIVTEFPGQTIGVDEAYLLRCAVLCTAGIPGDVAEVGVYRGQSAKVICEAKGERTLHLFDTFEGLPDPSATDAAFRKGQYECSEERVRDYLSSCSNLHFYKGRFPETGERVKQKKFSFVHLDVDLYESTLASLRFFYPRMQRGAILISHDYVGVPPVRKAFDEYFSNSNQPVLELPGDQCLVVRVKPEQEDL